MYFRISQTVSEEGDDCEVTEYIPPIRTWPTGNDSIGYDVITGIGLETQGQFDFVIIHPNLTYRAVRFTGLPGSWLDLSLSGVSSIVQDTWFTMFIYPVCPAYGTLMHYRHTGGNSGLTDIRMWINVTGSLHISYSGDADYGTYVIDSSATVKTNAWQFLAVARLEAGYLQVILDGETIFNTSNAHAAIVPVQFPGILRIGSGHDDTTGCYRGHVTCVNFFTEMLTSDQDNFVLLDCANKEAWNSAIPGKQT
jgi:hypothetical protein